MSFCFKLALSNLNNWKFHRRKAEKKLNNCYEIIYNQQKARTHNENNTKAA